MQRLGEKLFNWASILEDKTREQAVRTSQMPFIWPHLALMPDAHLGKGATVGSVIPTDRAIIPAAVGVDIGCGMIAVRTQWTESQVRSKGELSALRVAIEKAIPLSAGGYNTESQVLEAGVAGRLAELEARAGKAGFDPSSYTAKWKRQLGSLGSGNHFIEVTADEEGTVWLFLHSGSRGVGNLIAQKHIKVARAQMEKWHIDLPDLDLAYLVEDTDEFWSYINEMRWAQDFALANREEMMHRLMLCVSDFMGSDVQDLERINCHHNFTQQENHYGKNLWISRKGAIQADAGRPGLIPGSMGTASYVVVGRGSKLSLNSSPHGAGREFSRTAARKRFGIEDLRTAMKGIEYRDTDAFIDEIPAAYKPIDQVMADADDLVKVKHTLHQILNVKGD
ncbi:RtcB family protein [Kineosporia succinea]|uniref:3'-phosphate/5'-hydroxy nucleic acid ligase n=1 Tax=Kineosporia succinea TaxID=84632 RepID=A0ABT9P770_9ACTN|nr:RtcB family protein [Kineosporia succinea]MDP9828518.1 tRNA-splicing ligase RtcB [Kineosporia succinea]